jgi:hypothetical protein
MQISDSPKSIGVKVGNAAESALVAGAATGSALLVTSELLADGAATTAGFTLDVVVGAVAWPVAVVVGVGVGIYSLAK